MFSPSGPGFKVQRFSLWNLHAIIIIMRSIMNSPEPRFCFSRGTNHLPVWPWVSMWASRRSCGGSGRGSVGWSGASSERGTAVSRRSSGMWLRSGGRQAQRNLLCSTIIQQGQRTSTEYIISCPSSSPLCRATERTLWRPVTHSLKNAPSKIRNLHNRFTPL